jgi:hypothetical protein
MSVYITLEILDRINDYGLANFNNFQKTKNDITKEIKKNV